MYVYVKGLDVYVPVKGLDVYVSVKGLDVYVSVKGLDVYVSVKGLDVYALVLSKAYIHIYGYVASQSLPVFTSNWWQQNSVARSIWT